MKIFSSLHLLAALGVLGVTGTASAQIDTSQWKCSACPYPKGTTGSVDAGVGYVSDKSQKFGDFTGLDNKGAFLDLNGNVSHRNENGYFCQVVVNLILKFKITAQFFAITPNVRCSAEELCETNL